jgi:hypothetical protein
MLAAQVNAHKYDSLNTSFGISWNGAPILCEAHLGCGWIALVGAVGGMGVILTDELPPMMRACSCRAPPLPCVQIGRRMDAHRIAFVFGASGGPLCWRCEGLPWPLS